MEEPFVEFVIRKDIGEMNVLTDTQLGMWKPNSKHNPPDQEQYPKPNVVETGSIRQATSRPDPRVATRPVRSFTPNPFYHIATPPEEFPEVFPLNSETDEEESGDIHITYARMVRVVDKEENDQPTTNSVQDDDREPVTNPFYGRLPSPGFTDSEEDLEFGEPPGVCQEDVELLSNSHATDHKLWRTTTTQEFQNYILVKIVISVYRKSLRVKENPLTRKLLRML